MIHLTSIITLSSISINVDIKQDGQWVQSWIDCIDNSKRNREKFAVDHEHRASEENSKWDKDEKNWDESLEINI